MRAMKRICGFLVSVSVVVLLATSGPAEPQVFRDIIEKAADKIPSLNDAVTEVPFLDDFNPKDMSLMKWLPRGSGGSFKLAHAGVFRFKSQSYCLHAGTYAPTEGDGYLYAPIMGPRAMIIRAILERTWNRPEIEQQDIQTLIWAILAHTKISDMRDGNLALALSVLTQDEIRDLNGGALGMIPDEVMSQAESRLPPAVHQVFAAEAQIIMDYLNSECGNAPPDLKNKFDSLCGG